MAVQQDRNIPVQKGGGGGGTRTVMYRLHGDKKKKSASGDRLFVRFFCSFLSFSLRTARIEKHNVFSATSWHCLVYVQVLAAVWLCLPGG